MNEREAIENLKNVSPLEMTNYLMECEFYNRESSEEILKDIDEKYTGKEGVINTFVVPAFLNILGNVGRELNIKQIERLNKMGLTPDRVVNELKDFSYESEIEQSIIEEDLYRESEERECRDFNRKKIDNIGNREKYREKHFGDNKTGEDEYTGEIIYNKNKDANKRNFKEKTKHTSDVDHIIPLNEKFNELGRNVALNDKDIKDIMNIDENFAMTNSKLNRSKSDQKNSEYVEKQNSNLTEETKKRMIEKEKEATKALNKKQNEVIFNKVKDSEERKRITKEIGKESLNTAGQAQGHRVAGDVVMLGIKASYYEVTEAIRKGVKYKTNQTTKVAAFAYRIKRIAKFVISKLKDVLSHNTLELIKGIVSNLAKLIVDLFAGILKNIAKIIVNGIGSIIQAVKILAKPKEEMSYAQKADAIVKLVASVSVIFLGDITKLLLSRVGVPEKFVGIVNALVLGFLSAFIGYALDKLDIFGANIDMRIQRVNEIFNERIERIEENTKEFVKVATEILNEQKKRFNTLKDDTLKALDENNYELVSKNSYAMSQELGIELGYSNTEEFKKYLDENKIIQL